MTTSTPRPNVQPSAVDSGISGYVRAGDVLSDTQETALDLYERGLNVFPIRRASKEPFVVRPLYYSRMHHCTPACTHKGKVDFTPLFKRANIALMMGRTSGNLIDIDCDSLEAFEMIGLKLAGLPYWAIKSHRGGAYLMRLAEGEAANMAEGETPFKDVQVWANRHYCLIPPSIHPSGTVYTWVNDPTALPRGESLPAVSVEDLHWLGVTLQTKKSKRWQEPDLFGMPTWAAVLSYGNRETYQGVPEGQRNHRLSRLAYDMAGNDIPYHEAEKAILTAAANCEPAYPKRETLATLKSAYSRVRYPSRKDANGTGPTVKDWQKAADFAHSYDWRETFGRRALTRKAVYLACIERARRDNANVFRASIRELSEHANVSKPVVIDSLHDLCPASDTHPHGAGLLRCVGRNEHTGANLYAFVFSDDYCKPLPVSSLCSVSGQCLQYPKTDAEQNVFGKLGIRAWQVWHYLLLHDANTRYEIAKKTGIPARSVYQAVSNLLGTTPPLIEYSIAEGVFYAEPVTDSTFERMAADEGLSKVQDRRDGYRLERERRVNSKIRYAREKEGEK